MIEKLKQLAQDTVVYGAALFLGRFLSFLLVPLYTNYIPKAELGILFNFFVVFGFLNILYSFGFDSGFFRFASEESTKEEKKSVFTMTFITIAVIALFSTLSINVFRSELAMLIPQFDKAELWITIASLVPLIDSLMFIPFSRLRLIRKTIRFGLLRLVMVIITVGLNLLLVMVFEMGITGVLISSVLGPLIIGLTFIPDLIRNITKKVDWKKWKEILKYSAPTVPASLSVIALQFIDQPVITAVLGPEALAVYGTNYKLALPMMMFVTMFEYAWKPFYLNRYKDDNANEMFKTVLNYYVATCGFIFLVVSGFIPYIVKMRIGDEYFIDPGYWSGIYIIPIIMGGYFFNGLFNQFSMGVNIHKATKYLPIAVGSAALVNLFGNILLLEHYGIDAAAWLTLISYAIAAAIIYYFSRKVFPIDYNWKKIIFVVLSVLLIYGLSLYLDNYFSGNLKAVPDLIAVVLYPVVLYFTGFFEKKELSYIKRLIKRK